MFYVLPYYALQYFTCSNLTSYYFLKTSYSQISTNYLKIIFFKEPNETL